MFAQETTRPYLSPSQIEMVCKCGEQYRRRYIEKEVIPPGISMLQGTGVHAGAKVNFQQKIESHRDLPVQDIVDASVAGFENELRNGYRLDDDEVAAGATVTIGNATDEIAKYAELHAKEVAPEYQPVLVESEFRITLPGTHDLLGIIDLADDKARVIDHKVTKKRKSQDEADSSVQLTAYAVGHKKLTGVFPSEVRYEVVVKNKTPIRQVVVSSRDEPDYAALANRINRAAAVIGSGLFMPATPGAWWCGPKWCGYWSSCPYVNSNAKVFVDLKLPSGEKP